jgi:hypothetical protein
MKQGRRRNEETKVLYLREKYDSENITWQEKKSYC